MQMKHPFIKIDWQDIPYKEKEKLKIEEWNKLTIKSFNIWFSAKEEFIDVIKLSI